MKPTNYNKTIAIIAAVLVFLLALFAFILSFAALRDLAQQHGISYPLLYPFIIDGFIVVASLSVLRNSLNGERTRYPWLLVGASTVVSIVFNIIHAEMELTSRVISSVPPAALFFAFELLMQQVKSEVQKRDDGLQKQYTVLQGENKSLQTRILSFERQLKERETLLQAKDKEIGDIMLAWQSLNGEHQTLARFNAKLVTAEQARDMLGVKDLRTVESRAAKLNGVSH